MMVGYCTKFSRRKQGGESMHRNLVEAHHTSLSCSSFDHSHLRD